MILKFLKSGVEKVQTALAKTRSALGGKLRQLFSGKLNADALEELERILYEADLGVDTAMALTEKIADAQRGRPAMTSEELIDLLRKALLSIVTQQPATLEETTEAGEPTVILIVGVNGSGKTTSLAKLAHLLQNQQKKVLVAAADTFRAAAIDQLEVWAQRLGADIVKGTSGFDPAAVAFDACSAAKARGKNVVLIDTAGRLHTKTPLMQELEKIKRACKKVVPSAPHETLLVLDATTGQNAVDQAKTFHASTPITGLVLAKLDGTAKGGIAVAIQKTLGVPIKFIGIGEGLDDLQPFEPEAFVNALFE